MRPGSSTRLPWLKLVAACIALGLHAAVLAMVLSSRVAEVSLGEPEALDIQFVELGPAEEPQPEAAAPEETPEVAEPEPEVVPEPEPEPEPEVLPEPEPEVIPEPEPEPEPEVVPEPPPEPEPEITPEPLPEPVVEEPEPEAVTEPPPPPPKVEPKPEPKPKPKPEPKPKPKPKPKPAPKPVVKVSPAPTKPAAKPQATGGAQQAKQALGESKAVDPDRPRVVGRVDYLGRRPKPVYPRASMRRGEQGRVVLRVLISPQGRVADVKVQRSSGYRRLDDSAIEAVKQARFRPYTENGIAYKALVDIPFDFVL